MKIVYLLIFLFNIFIQTTSADLKEVLKQGFDLLVYPIARTFPKYFPEYEAKRKENALSALKTQLLAIDKQKLKGQDYVNLLIDGKKLGPLSSIEIHEELKATFLAKLNSSKVAYDVIDLLPNDLDYLYLIISDIYIMTIDKNLEPIKHSRLTHIIENDEVCQKTPHCTRAYARYALRMGKFLEAKEVYEELFDDPNQEFEYVNCLYHLALKENRLEDAKKLQTSLIEFNLLDQQEITRYYDNKLLEANIED